MTPEQIRALARDLIQGQVEEPPDMVTIFEVADDSEHVPGGQLTEDDARAVHDEIRRAVVTVTWPDGDHVQREQAVTAVALAVDESIGDWVTLRASDHGYEADTRELARITIGTLLDAGWRPAPAGAAQELEFWAAQFRERADQQYPEAVFTLPARSLDGAAAAMARHVYRLVADDLTARAAELTPTEVAG